MKSRYFRYLVEFEDGQFVVQSNGGYDFYIPVDDLESDFQNPSFDALISEYALAQESLPPPDLNPTTGGIVRDRCCPVSDIAFSDDREWAMIVMPQRGL